MNRWYHVMRCVTFAACCVAGLGLGPIAGSTRNVRAGEVGEPADDRPAALFVAAGPLSAEQKKTLNQIKKELAAVKAWTGRVDVRALESPLVLLPLPPRGSATVRARNSVATGPDEVAWYGDLDEPKGGVRFDVRQGDVRGVIHAGADHYLIRPVGDGVHAIFKVDARAFPPDHPNALKARQGGKECADAAVAESWIDSADERVTSEWPTEGAAWWLLFQDAALDEFVRIVYQGNLALQEAGTRVLKARASGGDAAVEIAIEGYDGLLVTLVADAVAAYIELRGYQERLVAARDNVTLQQETAKLVEARFEMGATTELDVQRASADLAESLATIPRLEAHLRLANNRLCTLMGMPPRDLVPDIGDGAIPAVPPNVVVGTPRDLLNRRPDLRRLRSEWRAYRDDDPDASAALLRYQHAALEANREVEDGIGGFLKSQERVRSLADRVEADERSVKRAIASYNNGVISFEVVSQLQRQLLVSTDELVAARVDVALSLTRINRALGNGWQIRLGEASPTGAAPQETAVPDESMTQPDEPVPSPGEAVPSPPPLPAPEPPKQAADAKG